MRVARKGVALMCVVAGATALSACGSDDNESTGTGASAASTQTTAAADGAAAGKLDAASIALGVQYTGGKAGKADASLKPISIGFVTQKGGTPSFPEQEAAADATVEFINEHAGGIDGHPVKLEKCFIQSEEDGQRCGAELVDKGVPVIHMALAIIGNASLYKTVAGKVPVLVGSTSTGPDSASKGVYSFSGGGPAVIYAMAQDVKELGAKNTALVSVGNPGGKFTMEKIAVPALDQLGVKHSKTVYYADDATTPDIVSSIQNAGGTSADVIFLDPSGPQQCTSTWDAMKQLGIKVPVVTTPICNADSFVEHTGDGPADWRLWGFDENPRVTGDPEVKLYNEIMDQYGKTEFKYVGFAPSSTRDILSLAKFGNELGADGYTPAAIENAIKTFKGPAFMVDGTQRCSDPLTKETPSVCGTTSIGSTFKDGAWVSLGATPNKFGATG
jgi:branched-chain amino acid transport system substrate-binding protein